MPFPVASELCTRFATQIVFRRSPTTEESITVSIIAAANADDGARKKLGGFSRSMTEFSAETFAQVLDEVTLGLSHVQAELRIIDHVQAAECMGLPRAGDDIDLLDKRFSNDVLKVEISGPQQDHLSFVDIPGLFHSELAHLAQVEASLMEPFQTQQSIRHLKIASSSASSLKATSRINEPLYCKM